MPKIQVKGLAMANHKSAAKRARQTIVRTERNRFYKTRIKNLTKAVKVAAEAGDKATAEAAFKEANKNLQKYVGKGVIKRSTAARRISRLAKVVNSVAA